MRHIIAAGALAMLSACSTAASDQTTQTLKVACDVDGVVVPIAQPIVANLSQTGAAVADMDSLLVHPAVVQARQALNGSPSSVAPVAVAVPAQPETSAKPAG